MLKLLCIFLSVATLSYAQICPSGWSPFNSKCLIVKTEKKAWFTAEEYCNQAAPKGHLTSISSAFENAKISALAQASGTSASQLWIGGTDLIQNGSYSWFDGQPLLYANWEQGQPDSSKHCVSSQAAGTGKWRTEVCNVQNGYICEAPMQVPSCPADWIYFPATQACYRVFMGASSWNDANSKCLGNGGNLTSVHSDVENNFIGALTSDYVDDDWYHNQTFIGMSDPQQNLQWSWSDGSATNYFNWAPGEPNGQHGNEFCVEMYSDVGTNRPDMQYHWNDTPCDETMRSFVCKCAPTWGA